MKVLLYGILQIDVCLRIQNHKKNKIGSQTSHFCKGCFLTKIRNFNKTPLPLLTLPIESAIKWPIMDGFQILRCLWKRLDKMLQSIILEFSKTASLVAKNVPK